MDFYAVLAQIIDLLQREGRTSYRALKRQFDLDDDYIEDLKEELIEARQLAADENGRVLVWTGAAARLPQAEAAAPAPPAPDAERRQLTVLFCDLVDSTALSRQLDPEDWRDVVRAYQQACAEVIQRFDGYIAQYLGDGLLVYFGYPQAHEDDAQRAVRTGLGMMQALGRLNVSLQAQQAVRLAIRVGLHTGLVVVGEMGGGARREHLALGETPNLAARLQALAVPDSVVLSGVTYRLVEGVFACRALGEQTLKGIATPVPVYQVVGERGVQSRFDIASPAALTPLVGREQEVGLLLERWEQVQEGRGQVVVLSGEAGIGKSRLVQVVKTHVAGEPHTRWECRASPYHQQSTLYPLIDLFARALQWQEDDTPDARVDKLEAALTTAAVPLPEVVPLLAALLSLPLPLHYAPLILTPQRQKDQTLHAILTVLLALAEQRPVLLIVEDLHWVDPSTLELLDLLIDQVPSARILALLTCRPEFRLPWTLRAHLTQLTLSRLPRAQVEALVQRVTAGKALPGEVLQQIAARTDGVPLFVEELTKMVLELGLLHEREEHYELTGPLPPLAIPATLHDSLMARLDRLTAAKAVAQLGAALGRAFPYALLQAVSPLDETTLQQALARLVEAELLYQRGVPPQATYLFKHALIQEAAYQSLLKSTRQQYHQRIAQVLEERFPDLVDTQPELLAQHYTEAGESARAIVYWQRAGERALQHSANLEAISHLRRGLEVLTTLPQTQEQLQQELHLHIPWARRWSLLGAMRPPRSKRPTAAPTSWANTPGMPHRCCPCSGGSGSLRKAERSSGARRCWWNTSYTWASASRIPSS